MSRRPIVHGVSIFRFASPLTVLLAGGCGSQSHEATAVPGHVSVPPSRPPPLVRAESAPWSMTSEGACPDKPERSKSPCALQTCGNGRIEPGCWPGPPPTPQVPDEECDGAALGGASCATLGFSGGTLRCTLECTLDTTGCGACERSEMVAACGRADVQLGGDYDGIGRPSPSFPFALAATDTELALGWLSGTTAGGRVAHFARFRPDLTKLSESDCAGATQLGVVKGGRAVSLVRRPGGWLVAASGYDGTTLRALDAEGHPAAETVHHFAIAEVSLVAAPGGRTLMLWPEGYEDSYLRYWRQAQAAVSANHFVGRGVARPYGIAAAILGADAAIAHGPAWVWNAPLPRAIALEGGFMLAGPAQFANDDGKVAGHGIGAGTFDAQSLASVARGMVDFGGSQRPEVVFTGREIVLVYRGLNTGIQMLRLDRKGAPLGPPVVASLEQPTLTIQARAVALDEDSLLLLFAQQSPTSPQHYDLYTARVRTDGQVERGPFRVSRGPAIWNTPGADFQLVRLGSEAIAAWSSGGHPHRIELARITP